jgi:hypothetical protein
LPPAVVACGTGLGRSKQRPYRNQCASRTLRYGGRHESRAYSGQDRPYKSLAENVSPWRISPVLYPFMNQRMRCSLVPWVKLSGTT